MRISDHIACTELACTGVDQSRYTVPALDLDPDRVRIVLISEAAPPDPAAGYYDTVDGEMSLFASTTVQAFQDAGADVATMADILDLGVYLTTAVKCGKVGYTLKAGPITTCSRLLEAELALFPQAQVYLLMGDVAIKAITAIARRAGAPRPIPAGSTYKIRGTPYTYQGKRALPSYLQAGPGFFIEKSKRRMIAEDIATALALIHSPTHNEGASYDRS